MRKKYRCIFEENTFINEKDKNYKNYCDFKNRTEKEPYKKFYDKRLFRYTLNCKLKEQGKSITVILMNPSYADEYGLDSTLRNVREFLEKQKEYSEFNVLNIFPIRTANSNHLLNLMKKYPKEIQEENNKYIKKVLNKSKYVLAAWGSKYHNEAKWITDLIKNKEVYAYSINKNGTPRHFAPQSYNRVKKYNKLKLKKYEL